MLTFARVSLAIALAVSAPAAFAQETAQAGIIGPSGNAEYPVRVRGANNIIYNCKEQTEVRNGRTVRPCQRLGLAGSQVTGGTAASGRAAGAAIARGSLFGGGTGLGMGAAAALGAGLIGTVAIIAASDTNN